MGRFRCYLAGILLSTALPYMLNSVDPYMWLYLVLSFGRSHELFGFLSSVILPQSSSATGISYDSGRAKTIDSKVQFRSACLPSICLTFSKNKLSRIPFFTTEGNFLLVFWFAWLSIILNPSWSSFSCLVALSGSLSEDVRKLMSEG